MDNSRFHCWPSNASATWTRTLAQRGDDCPGQYRSLVVYKRTSSLSGVHMDWVQAPPRQGNTLRITADQWIGISDGVAWSSSDARCSIQRFLLHRFVRSVLRLGHLSNRSPAIYVRNHQAIGCWVLIQWLLSFVQTAYPIERGTVVELGITGVWHTNPQWMCLIQELSLIPVCGILMCMHVKSDDRCPSVDPGNRVFLESFSNSMISRIPPSGQIFHSMVMAGPASRSKQNSLSSNSPEVLLQSTEARSSFLSREPWRSSPISRLGSPTGFISLWRAPTFKSVAEQVTPSPYTSETKRFSIGGISFSVWRWILRCPIRELLQLSDGLRKMSVEIVPRRADHHHMSYSPFGVDTIGCRRWNQFLDRSISRCFFTSISKFKNSAFSGIQLGSSMSKKSNVRHWSARKISLECADDMTYCESITLFLLSTPIAPIEKRHFVEWTDQDQFCTGNQWNEPQRDDQSIKYHVYATSLLPNRIPVSSLDWQDYSIDRSVSSFQTTHLRCCP